MKFGVLTSKCSAAASATGPIEQCGATRMSRTAAMAAIFLAIEMPPQWADVHLHDVDGPRRRQPMEVGQRVQPLARRNRSGDLPFDVGQQVDALGRDRLFAPGGGVRLQAGGSLRTAQPAESRP